MAQVREATSYAPGAERVPSLTPVVGALLAVTAAGTLGFVLIEGWDLGRALFFTLITITTVGYGDEGISDAGRVFAVVLLLVGIGVASYAFSQVVRIAVASEFAWRRRMQHKVDTLGGHTIVCGFGRMGRTVCEQLTQFGIPFVVVETGEEALTQARDQGCLFVEGSATEDDVLERAGVERASHLVTALDSDAQNIVVTLTARELSPAIEIIARAEREEDVRKLRRAGATRIVSPFQSGGFEVANAIARPKIADLLARTSRAESDLALAEIQIEAGSTLVGGSLGDYGAAEGARLAFVALERDGSEPLIPPRGSVTLRALDLLIVAGHPDDVIRMRERARA